MGWKRSLIEFLGVPTSRGSVQRRLAAGAATAAGLGVAGAVGGAGMGGVNGLPVDTRPPVPPLGGGRRPDWDVLTHTPAPRGVNAPAVGGRLSLGGLGRAAELGVPAILQWLGNRSQVRGMDVQSQREQEGLAAQLAFAREQEAARRAEAERAAAEDARRWAVEEENRKRQMAADEEERAFARRLAEEREARRAPRRRASADALVSLQDLIRAGRR